MSRQSRLDAEKLSIINSSKSRGRSVSPSRSTNNSRSSSILNEEFSKDLKWSITNHDPLERLRTITKTKHNDDDDATELWDNEVSEEEHISDDDTNEKFQYDDTGNILPNYACRDEKINEISTILENSNLTDQSTIKKLEELTANERAFAAAKNIGSAIDKDSLDKLANDKHKLTGQEGLDLSKSDQDVLARKQKLENYQAYRRLIIEKNQNASHIPSPADKSDKPEKSDKNGDEVESDPDFMIPYTSAVEDRLDSEFASILNETIREGEIDSNRSQSRVIQTITRGNFFQLINPKVKPKMFLVCMDFSPESIFALEWCLGTVLVDGSVLFIIYVIEENDNHHLKTHSVNESSAEAYRLNMLTKAKQQVLNLLKLTKLQIHIVIEIVHHPIPRHLILELIDNLKPTLVVVGSKGQSALKGVLLGSLSNYLVTKSSVPVMVVREKLKKINRFKSGSSVFSNNIKPLTLSEARID
ncbi:adenine nucleotide alpha hydrolases-like protein [Suhomyces tanzawaensis NRRL Y-17324]|uniref:Adenine nucleotide alpha hydrolases-like protein n=1 Tax=Suhomyces tanzawaensis NRRL Y-17324 TaxID=984487 RepID=A0A1E4SES0_9ASCO|nr:adenine nucleotide alpha hydrolases-like protein [Suhomyces tanzawaensis NRRL Y-17324]ODV78029.1 adenine nucleotide alpha hydrolases-like protein [Suhomyces tanzawaensis NRRL Y-17324]